jgi:hypothetical protein
VDADTETVWACRAEAHRAKAGALVACLAEAASAKADALGARWQYDRFVAKKDSVRLQSEREIPCPCCNAVLIIDLNLGRVISHSEPPSGFNIELSDAQRILADEKARRDAAFEQSFNTERTKGDALSKRFEEALKQAREEPISKPTRDFDLD